VKPLVGKNLLLKLLFSIYEIHRQNPLIIDVFFITQTFDLFTIYSHFQSVLNAMVRLSRRWINLPDPFLVPSKILNNTKYYPYFSNCIGAIDGSQIHARVPEDMRNACRNRKGFISQNVLAACTFNLCFCYVLAGWEGSAHDGRVLNDALQRDFIIPPGKYYLGDAGYGLSTQILTPYRGTRYHLNETAQANLR